VSLLCGRVAPSLLLGFTAVAASASIASAQTTVSLNQPNSQVVYATLRGGTYAAKNYPTLLATQASTDSTNARRALLKFDTQNLIPAGSNVTSAVLTLTVNRGGTDASRTVAVYQGTTSWTETEATWTVRRVGQSWTTPGGDMGSELARQPVSNVAGTRVSFDVTPLVQQAVAGALGASRYTRVEVVDTGTASANSYREFVSPDDANAAARPVLKVTYGAAAATTSPAPIASTTLRVLQYNVHHGGWGTDNAFDPNRILNWLVRAKPDLISLQELEVADSWSNGLNLPLWYKQQLEHATGRTWYAFWASRYGTAMATSGQVEMILSKYPFVATSVHTLDAERTALNVTVDVNGRTINFTSAHLDNASQATRLKEIDALLYWETSHAEQRIVAGDMNAWPNTAEIANITRTYTDTWAMASSQGTAASWSANPDGITHGAHRIDYVFQSKSATLLRLKGTQVFDTSDGSGQACVVTGSATCYKNSTGIDPSDHRPVLAEFEVR